MHGLDCGQLRPVRHDQHEQLVHPRARGLHDADARLGQVHLRQPQPARPPGPGLCHVVRPSRHRARQVDVRGGVPGLLEHHRSQLRLQGDGGCGRLLGAEARLPGRRGDQLWLHCWRRVQVLREPLRPWKAHHPRGPPLLLRRAAASVAAAPACRRGLLGHQVHERDRVLAHERAAGQLHDHHEEQGGRHGQRQCRRRRRHHHGALDAAGARAAEHAGLEGAHHCHLELFGYGRARLGRSAVSCGRHVGDKLHFPRG
mmetsp:Transcript_52383/g.114192  ORF Transcript_52383/g.114192 Transcript_52383/m.114192 type:complete len:257 (-) Transcript_52383:719-1489(-)